MDLRALRYFIEVVRQNGFTRAAETLHVTQPTISKMVKALEDEFGGRLLLREGRGVQLTDAGQVVYDRGLEILEQNQIPFAFFKVEFFSDYLQVLKTFTDLTGNPELYELYGSGIEINIQDILDRTKDQPRPTVLLIRASAKGAKAKNAENATGAMLSELGADNIADRYPSLLEDMSLEQVIMEDPDFILITTMGSEEQAMSYLETGIMANPAWNSLSAVDNQHVIVLPKDLFHYKPNARWDEAYEYLAEVLYPEAG